MWSLKSRRPSASFHSVLQMDFPWLSHRAFAAVATESSCSPLQFHHWISCSISHSSPSSVTSSRVQMMNSSGFSVILSLSPLPSPWFAHLESVSGFPSFILVGGVMWNQNERGTGTIGLAVSWAFWPSRSTPGFCGQSKSQLCVGLPLGNAATPLMHG